MNSGDTVQIGADFNTLNFNMIIQEKINQYTGDLWPIENCIYYTFQDTFYSFEMSRNTDNLKLNNTFLNKDQIDISWKKKKNFEICLNNITSN